MHIAGTHLRKGHAQADKGRKHGIVHVWQAGITHLRTIGGDKPDIGPERLHAMKSRFAWFALPFFVGRLDINCSVRSITVTFPCRCRPAYSTSR
jgi:hypothetical protein